VAGSAEVEERYRARTPRSADLMHRAAQSMTRGVTRSLSWFEPYPIVFDHGDGALLYDVDGHRYIDLMLNGLSLIHGNAYPPIQRAIERSLARGCAWPGTSDVQIEFAELLLSRIKHAGHVRFANTGSEATMLAVKLARHVTGRPIIIKAINGFHGSYGDFDAGLHGAGPVPGRMALARFGDLGSFAEQLHAHAGAVSAIIVEAVMYTRGVTEPPSGFLPDLELMAREAGVLLILDDCLMFRLTEGGSAERFGFTPDITVLGKWIGGGIPVGAILASTALMASFDPCSTNSMYHGGSFNGNLLGCAAGIVAVRDLTAGRISTMNRQAERLQTTVHEHARALGLRLSTPGDGAAFAFYLLDEHDEIDWAATRLLQLAAALHGVYLGSSGEAALPTVITDELIDDAGVALGAALDDVASTRTIERATRAGAMR
jgi:glutamate-1-semialdehyde 2,1-aminomutase